MDKCPRCGNYVSKLFPLDNDYETSVYTELLKMPYPCTDYLCIKCLNVVLGISKDDVLQEGRAEDNTYFNVNILKGNIAQSIIGMIFRDCGYEVYPFGYESYFTNIIKNLKKGNANVTARIVRSSPNILVYDRESNDCFLLEIKATNAPDECSYEMSIYDLEKYKEYWNEAVLIVYCVRTANIYCKPFSEIDTVSLNKSKFKKTGVESRVLDLKKTFSDLPDYFSLIDKNKYRALIDQIKKVLFQFNTI